jgi:phospholipid/cholesterol/gamma-HCH transport system ATP-binding protein
MADALPVLELVGALPDAASTRLPAVPLDLQLLHGQCALIEARDSSQATDFADLCCGMLPLRQGSVRFLGRDWLEASEEQAQAMRGRIGRLDGMGHWIGFLGTDANILLSQLHHTRHSETALRETAAELAHLFGLPGLPLMRPEALADTDLARAACVRAFIGEPLLLILEAPEQEQVTEIVASLHNALAAARDRQAAVVWLTRSDLVWNDRSFPATMRLRLSDRGLVAVRAGAA